jgi:hypothetical protein
MGFLDSSSLFFNIVKVQLVQIYGRLWWPIAFLGLFLQWIYEQFV